jgi:hypothetical protein
VDSSPGDVPEAHPRASKNRSKAAVKLRCGYFIVSSKIGSVSADKAYPIYRRLVDN